MVKQKLNVSDIIVLINDFNKELLNARLTNVYDINARSFLLKFTKESKEKAFVLIDSNPQSPRFHITNQEFERRMIPSSFCNKLRKHLTNKRITNIRQLGMDRVVDFQFGNDNVFHIIIELYDSGNLVLTDQDYNIIILVRRYNLNKDQEDELNIKVGEKYPVEGAYQEIEFNSELELNIKNLMDKSIEENKKTSLRNILISGSSPIVNFGKDMIVHSINKMGWNANKKHNPQQLEEFDVSKFLNNLKEIYQEIDKAKGYIILQENEKVDFTPLLYHQFNKYQYQEFDNLSQAIDKYFVVNSVENKSQVKHEKKQKDLDKIERIEKSINDKIEELDKKIYSLEIADYLMNNIDQFSFLENFDPNNCNISNVVNIDQKNKLISYQVSEFKNPFNLDYTQNIWNNIKNYHSNKKDLKLKINKTEISGKKALDRLKSEAKKIKKRRTVTN